MTGNIPKPSERPTVSDYSFWRYMPNQYVVVTTTASVKSTDGLLTGIMTNGNTALLTITDSSTQGASPVIHQFTAAANTVYQIPEMHFQNGCYVTVTTGRSVTILYK